MHCSKLANKETHKLIEPQDDLEGSTLPEMYFNLPVPFQKIITLLKIRSNIYTKSTITQEILYANNNERSGASSKSKDFSHSHIRAFRRHGISKTIDFQGLGYRRKKQYFFISLKNKPGTANTFSDKLFLTQMRRCKAKISTRDRN